ncbi:hypothetical protein LCGC14_1256970 [marine sediment metagenome]|uniref:Uncharacterized protein n=1 Tax=marine sediment metagenome TaxID=412755 RepID=A0A0F9NIE9_9ZZZZ
MEAKKTPLVPEVMEPEEDNPRVIAGHTMTVLQVRLFELWTISRSKAAAWRALKKEVGQECIAQKTANGWFTETWWKEMERDFFEDRRLEHRKSFVNLQKKSVKAMGKILDGTYKEPKMANAAAVTSKLIAEAGPSPLVDRRPQVQIDARTQVQNTTFNFQRLGELTQEELQDILDGAPMPRKVLEEE